MSRQAEHLALAARKAEMREQYVASTLAQYRQQERLEEKELREKLDCFGEDYYRLALCQTPDVRSEHFSEAVRHVASFANASAVELAKIIKQVQSIQTLSSAEAEMTRDATLLAARDRSSNSEENDGESSNGET